jgi:hypothetical protein
VRTTLRVPPGTYKVACVGHRLVTSKANVRGVELLLKIIKPSKMRSPSSGRLVKVGGKVIRHVFWATMHTLAYTERDARVILGRRPSFTQFVTSAGWIGKTCEADVRDDVCCGGVPESRVRFFNAWKPKRRSSGGVR